MNYVRLLVLLHFGLVLAVSTNAQDALQQMTVSPKMDIFRAGGYNDGSNGETPVEYVFRPASGRVLAFSAVLGIWNCLYGAQYYGPDGTNLCPPVSIAGPVGPFSGFNATDFEGSLVGMFLEDSLPLSAPPTLRFYVSDYSQGGIPTHFKYLFPRIGQVFFIGDGRTGTGTGDVQLFAVPDKATRLYLGYVDSCDVGYSTPGCYSDNSGGLSVVFSLYDADASRSE